MFVSRMCKIRMTRNYFISLAFPASQASTSHHGSALDPFYIWENRHTEAARTTRGHNMKLAKSKFKTDKNKFLF